MHPTLVPYPQASWSIGYIKSQPNLLRPGLALVVELGAPGGRMGFKSLIIVYLGIASISDIRFDLEGCHPNVAEVGEGAFAREGLSMGLRLACGICSKDMPV